MSWHWHKYASLLVALFITPSAMGIDLHIMVPGGAGSGWDSTARGTGMVLRETGLVEQVSFENISGAGGGRAIGTMIETAARQSNTLMVNSTPIIVRSLTNVFPFSFRDLTPVARLIGDYQVLVARPDSELTDFRRVLERFRQNPRSVKICGGSVRGDLDHLVPALAFRSAGEDARNVVYVPYDGGGKALAGFLTGEGDLLSTGLGEALEYHRAGKLRIIAVSSRDRVPGLEAIPTFAEHGIDFEFINWRGFFAPPGTPVSVADEYAELFRRAMATPQWETLRQRNGWQNFFLDRPSFNVFLEQQEDDLRNLMLELGFMRRASR